MADRLDVAERLAEGRPAVEHTQVYVQACHTLGFGHPDLTSHPSQVRDWYDSEDGLDLHALDRDCAALRTAGAAVTEALRMQRAQVAELAAAWTGPGGDSAVALLQRHCDAGATVATELRAAAQRCESLRDNLWYLVDSKVATAVAIDDRTRPQRQAWLAAAATVTSGAGDRPSAEQVIREQVEPYVREDVRNDWLTTMRSTVDGVATSYDMVTDRMAAAPTARFEFPGDLGVGYQPVPPTFGRPGAPSAAAAAVPAAAVSGPAIDPAPSPTPAVDPAPPPTPAANPAPPPIPATAGPVPDWGTALGDASSAPAGDLGGGLGGQGGLAGLASRIVDAMSGLLGSATDDLGDHDPFGEGEDPFDTDDTEDPSGADDADDDTPDKRKEPEHDQTDEVDTGKAAEPAPGASPAGAAIPASGQPPPEDAPAPAAATAPPTGEAAPRINAVPPAPSTDEASTPCEIAADQLPQAGQ